MKYTIENNGSGVCMIRVCVPETLAAAFLAFIDQKSRENHPRIKSVSPVNDENFFSQRDSLACSLFQSALDAGSPIKTALSTTNYKLKAAGYANVSYDITKQILQKLGKLKRKSP